MTAAKAQPRRVLITGATSAIARGIARCEAQRGSTISLAGRDLDEVERLATDLRIAFEIKAHAVEFDAEREHAGTKLIEQAAELIGGLDTVYVVHGAMWDQAAVDEDPTLAGRMAVVNLASVSEIAHAVVKVMSADAEPASKRLVLVSSVAGDRGRPSNVAYGASKAGVNELAEGLRGRLRDRGIRVVLIKPGFVDTAMTWGQDGMFLVAEPGSVGRGIVRAADRGRPVVYTPWFWRWIMLIIRLIPRPVFDRMGL